MILRSLLFVPGDSDRKLAKAQLSGADALVLDLEDAVAAERLPVARGMVREYLKSRTDRSKQQLWVRVNPLQTPLALEDLAGVIAGAPDGIMLPKCDSAAQTVTLSHYLSALEAREGLPLGRTKILPVATETPRAMFALDSYAGSSDRLIALTWGAEDLSAALGASSKYDADGELSFTYKLARTLCLAGAVAAGVQPVDGVFADFRDEKGLRAEAEAARREGFTGKLAIHPAQVPIINLAFTPSADDVRHAEQIVAAFEAHPDAGVLSVDGKMVDRPHLVQARRVLERVR